MPNRSKIDIVEAYFRHKYLECDLCSRWDNTYAEWRVHITLKHGTEMPEVRVTREFLRDYEADKIPEQLTVWRVSECLQVASEGKCVLVTDTGIQILNVSI